MRSFMLIVVVAFSLIAPSLGATNEVALARQLEELRQENEALRRENQELRGPDGSDLIATANYHSRGA